MRNWLKNIGVSILFALLVIFIIVWLTYTIYLLKSDQQLANAYVAVSTLMLALATVLLAGLTWLSIRSGEKREKRRRKEDLLDEVIEWAIDIAKTETQGEFLLKSRKSMLIGLLLKYQAVDARSEYIKVTAAKFGEDFQVAVIGTAEKLDEHLVVLKKQIEGKTTAEERDKHWRSLMEASIALTKKAAEIKTRDIG